MENKEMKPKFKVVSFLKREELDFLDNLAKDIYFSSGLNIPRTKLIEEIIEAFKDNKVMNKEELQREFIQKFREEREKNNTT
ncbi:MAG: hypothetical protein QXZ20_03250 [Candidatus Aenigmatarchaeota archaeon]